MWKWCDRRRLKETERDDAGLLSKFLDDMMPARLSWQFPREKDYFWVFWSEKTTSHQHRYVKDRIKTALSGFKYPYSGEVLVQFCAAPEWLTTSDPKRLTTCDPFAISCLADEKLIQYKKDCPINKSVAEDRNGLISRVFNATVALPVYAPSRPVFVGVLELLFTEYTGVALDRSVYEAIRRLEDAGLETVNPMDWIRSIREVHFVLVEEELTGAMGQVLKTHGLPLACVWARQPACHCVRARQSAGRGLLLMQVYDLNGRSDDDYNHISFYLPFTEGRVPFQNWFHSDKPCFFGDVAQLRIIDYPMAHFARMSRFTSCFVVCLQSIANKNCDYVLEFFLPRDNRRSGDLHIFLSSILMILKQHLKSFEVVTGDIINDLLTEVDNLTESNVESSMVKEKNVEFTYTDYETISATEAEDSAQSLHTESTSNSTARKPDI